jgi:3-hydroxyacyl-CoA dehydrogenase/enoyl-CoA hydratase/3-hydroxybutyryl-CoA epimerase
MRHLSTETGPDGIAVLTLDHAEESVNLVTDAWLADMEEAVSRLTSDPKVIGVVVTSAKRSFMAGADLKQLVAGYETLSKNDAVAFSQRATAMHRAIETSGKPWVAALNGFALGGGFELALACHRRILVDDPKAVVGLPEVNVALLPGSGGTQRLPRMIGVKAALDLLLNGRSVAGKEAVELGLVDQLVPSDELQKASRDWISGSPDPVRAWDRKGFSVSEARGLLHPETAALFSATSAAVAKTGYNQPAPATILSCVFEGIQLPFDRALKLESKYFAKLLTGPVARNIIRTTFISKAAAEKGARRPIGLPPSSFTRIGIIGAGMMGAGIALVSALAGIEVVLIDRDEAIADKGKDQARATLTKAVERGRREPGSIDPVLARIAPTADFARLAGCELVVEAVFEDVGIKSETIRKAEAVLPANAVFASNTSTLPISRLASASRRPGQFIGMHFFSPVDRMDLVEIINGKQTSDDTLARALDLVAQLRKTPIVVNDSRGFYTSRVFQVMTHEGGAMLQEGVPPAVIENAARQIGMPVGPLALQDEVSFDLPLKIIDEAAAEVENYVAPAGAEALRRMRDEFGRGGRKTGGGYYEYPAQGSKRLWPELARIFPPKVDYDFEDLKKRLLYIQALETARCLEEGVLETPEDADLGSVFGWGFPQWTGGTLSFIDTVGVRTFVHEADRLAQLYGSRFAPSAWLRERAANGVAFYAPPRGEVECAA